MRELPLLANTQVALALFEGRQTQDRRPIKPQPRQTQDGMIVEGAGFVGIDAWRKMTPKLGKYQVGDHLYVKEPFRVLQWRANKVYGLYTRDSMGFGCELTQDECEKFYNWKKPKQGKSSLFMFKSLARTWLEVTAVRVERVQDITAKDIVCEGIQPRNSEQSALIEIGSCSYDDEIIERFAELWDSIYGKTEFSWDNNPWNFVYEFKKIERI